MILLDTSVLVAYLRTASPAIRQVLTTRPALVSGVTRSEILHGARSDADYQRLVAALDVFPRVDFLDSDWDIMGRHLSILRRAGVTVPFQGAAIATLAIRDNLELWTHDAHFRLIRTHLPALRLLADPSLP